MTETSTTQALPTEAIQTTGGRRVGLIIFGCILILFGVMCVAGAAMMAVSVLIVGAVDASQAGLTWQSVVPAVLIYTALAIMFVWTGIGSILCRRWARAVILAGSATWLACGILGSLFFIVLMPDIYGPMEAELGAAEASIIAIVKIVTLVMLVAIYVIIPGVFVLFYAGKKVKSTCEIRDPVSRWTDRCPLPVLAAVLMMGFGTVSLLSMPFYGFIFPFFGQFLSGARGAMAWIPTLIIMPVLAVGLYRLRHWAWATSLVFMGTWSLSSIVTMAKSDMTDMYELMGFPPEQLELMEQYDFYNSPSLLIYGAISMALMLGYIVWLRRYFVADDKSGFTNKEGKKEIRA